MALEQKVILSFQSKGRLIVPLEDFLNAKINAVKNTLDARRRQPSQKVSYAEMLESEKGKLAQEFGFDDGE